MATLNYQRVCYCFSCVVIMSAQANEAAQAGSQQRDLHRHLGGGVFFPPQFGSRFFQRGITQIPKGDFMRVGSTKERYLTKCPTVFHSHQREGNFFSWSRCQNQACQGRSTPGAQLRLLSEMKASGCSLDAATWRWFLKWGMRPRIYGKNRNKWWETIGFWRFLGVHDFWGQTGCNLERRVHMDQT